MHETSGNSPMVETLEMFPLETSQMQTSSLEDSLARLFQQQGNEQGSLWRTHAGHLLLKCFDSLGIKQFRTSYLRTSRDSSITTVEEPSASSSKSWMGWGMTVNGSCLTAKISESRSTENGCSLSDILETDPDPKYFLSEAQLAEIMRRTEQNQQEGRGFSPTFLRPSTPTPTRVGIPDLM